jgi:hypothetical protein
LHDVHCLFLWRKPRRGYLNSPESSAALAVNAFGWFLEQPAELPPIPPLADIDWAADRADVEPHMRFPWQGGRHPWLDAVETPTLDRDRVEAVRAVLRCEDRQVTPRSG